MKSTMAGAVPEIRSAREADFAAVEELLEAAHLGSEELSRHFENFFIAEIDGRLVGAIGLECYEKDGLLRSAAVDPQYQSKGIGRRFVETIISYAGQRGITRLVLLTTTAEAFFRSNGFSRVGRETIQGDILTSAQFRYACPESAAVMVRALTLPL
jgi:amino-acid N-acetyltransferase